MTFGAPAETESQWGLEAPEAQGEAYKMKPIAQEAAQIANGR